MSLRTRLLGALKAEYLWQPRVLARRLLPRIAVVGKVEYPLPGGATITAVAEEEHGRMLATLGVVDLPVTEALWRLADEGEVCADVGANIGYMSGILAARVRRGRIHSFEALPTIFAELERNVGAFARRFPGVSFHTHSGAVSARAGTVRMELPDGFGDNHGLARVGEGGTLEVRSMALDDVFEAQTQIGVMKIDVEGHELSVLEGAEKLFDTRRVRDCLFEEHRPFPTDVTTWFEERGYTVFRVLRPILGPKLVDPSHAFSRVAWLPQGFLATCDPTRARARFAPRGWKSLA